MNGLSFTRARCRTCHRARERWIPVPFPPPLALVKAFYRSGQGRIFPLFSRVVRKRAVNRAWSDSERHAIEIMKFKLVAHRTRFAVPFAKLLEPGSNDQQTALCRQREATIHGLLPHVGRRLAASAFFSSGVNGGEGRLAKTPSKIKTSALVCSFSQKRSSSAKRVFMEARRSRLACFIRSRGVLSRLSFSSRSKSVSSAPRHSSATGSPWERVSVTFYDLRPVAARYRPCACWRKPDRPKRAIKTIGY